jgi:hypothetical protein
LFFLLSAELLGGCVGQELETSLIEVLLVVLTAIVVRKDLVQGRVDLGVHIAFSLDLTLDLVEDLEAVVVLTQVELLFSLGDAAQVHGIAVSL